MSRLSHHTAAPAQPQTILTDPDLWATEVVPQMPPDLAAHARLLGAVRRRRALASATDLVRAILAAVVIITALISTSTGIAFTTGRTAGPKLPASTSR